MSEELNNRAKRTYNELLKSLDDAIFCAAVAHAASVHADSETWEGTETLKVIDKMKHIFINFSGGRGHENEVDEYFKK